MGKYSDEKEQLFSEAEALLKRHNGIINATTNNEEVVKLYGHTAKTRFDSMILISGGITIVSQLINPDNNCRKDMDNFDTFDNDEMGRILKIFKRAAGEPIEKTYVVRAYWKQYADIVVKAQSDDEAIEKANERYFDGDYEAHSDDAVWDEPDFEIVDRTTDLADID